jgi:hypothetical protein
LTTVFCKVILLGYSLQMPCTCQTDRGFTLVN